MEFFFLKILLVVLPLVSSMKFPTWQQLKDTIHILPNSIPLNMTECTFEDLELKIDVFCDHGPSLMTPQVIDGNQLPGNVRSLRIHNSSVTNTTLENKTVYMLEIFDNEALDHVDESDFQTIGDSLLALSLRKTGLKVKEHQKQSFLKLFNQLRKLRYLLLEHNAHLHLEDIGTEDNTKTPVLKDLEYLSFEGSDLQTIENQVFKPLNQSMNLKFLNLKNCNLSSIRRHTFEYLPYLEQIDFSGNAKLLFVDPLHAGNFLISTSNINDANLKSLGFADTNLYTIPYLLLKQFQALEYLDLSRNHFNLLGHWDLLDLLPPIFPTMISLKKLDMKFSAIWSIEEDTFSGLNNLKHLDLTGNGLTWVPRAVLLPSLEILDMSYQNDSQKYSIDLLNIPFNLEEKVFEKTNMTNLKSFSLSGVTMKTLKKFALAGLDNLEILNLDHTKIEYIENGVFEHVPNLKYLDLSHNKDLTNINEETIKGLSKLEILNLEYTSKAFISERTPYLNLDSLQELRVLNIRCALNPDCSASDDFASPLDPEYLRFLAKLEILDMSENSLAQWNDDRFAYNKNLKKLNLRKNKMSGLTKGLITSMSRLQEVDFRDNRFECDEMIVAFINMTRRNTTNLKVVGWNYGNGYFCRNGTNLTQITFTDYYEWYNNHKHLTPIEPKPLDENPQEVINILIYAGITVIAACTAFGLGYLIHKDRFKITYKLILAWHRLTSDGGGGKNANKPSTSVTTKYDAFISYCHDDQAWIMDELIPELETKHQIRCCIHQRDFSIGVTVLQNIINCLDQSKVFIAILSHGYASSSWCMFELFLAQSRMKQTDSNLIVIVKQNIKDVSRLDKKLQVILKLWTYLPWPTAALTNNLSSSQKIEREKEAFWQRLNSCIKMHV